jgi:hypothetical protein
MMGTFAGRALRLLGAAVAVAGLGAGAAYGMSLVRGGAGATGVIEACANGGNGGLRVVANNQTDCHRNETPISWNAVGPAGPPGVSPTVAQLAAGDPHCAAGGAAITDASGSVAYVCNGAPFSGTFTSPSGGFSLRVDDNGIELAGPNSQLITLDASGIRIKGENLNLEGGLNTQLRTGLSLDIRAGTSASLKAAGALTVEGSNVTIDGAGGCHPAARQGDAVAGGVIAGGSPQVCIGP